MIQTILLPTDFSVTATNAGLYAVELAKQIGAKKLWYIIRTMQQVYLNLLKITNKK